MKRTTTTTTEEYDEKGNLQTKIVEVSEEEGADYPYLRYPIYPWYPPATGDNQFFYAPNVTCERSEE